MVTSQINGFGFTAAAASTSAPTANSDAFLQALQGEISQVEGTAICQTDETFTITPEFLEKLQKFITNLLEKQCGGNEDLAKQIIEALLEKLKGEDDEDEKTQTQSDLQNVGEPKEDKNVGMEDVPDSILEIIKAMLENMQQELKEQSDATFKAEMNVSAIVDAGVISIDAHAASTVSEFIPKIETTEASEKIQPTTEQSPKTDETRNFAQFTDVIQTNPVEDGKITFEAPVIHAGVEEMQDTATNAAEPVQTSAYSKLKTQNAIQNSLPTQNTVNLDLQAVSQKADEILTQLIQFAKSELGLTDAALTTASQAEEMPAQTQNTVSQTVFFAIPNMVRPQAETQNELSELIEGINAPQTESTTNVTQNTVTGKTADENQQSETETESAVKMPTEFIENAQQPVIQTAPSFSEIKEAPEAPVYTQVSERVLEALSTMTQQDDGTTTFRMTLNPESLGQIEVKVATSDGKVTVEITTQSKQTQSILAERLDGLQTALKQNGVELEKYQVVYAPEQTQNDDRSYDGSSKNPYSRRQSEKNDENDESVEFSELLKAL